MACGGPVGDRTNFSEFILRNLQWYKYQNDVPMTTHAAANFTRNELASSLRTRNAYQVSILIGGYDKTEAMTGPSLYYMDYLGSMHKMDRAAQGYAGHFCWSTLDRYYHDLMTLPEALDLLKKCFHELKSRMVLNLGEFKIKVRTREETTYCMRQRFFIRVFHCIHLACWTAIYMSPSPPALCCFFSPSLLGCRQEWMERD